MVIERHAIDDENVAPIPRTWDHSFGITLAKRHPPYVFSIRGPARLVHKVAYVELHWWRIAGRGEKLVKMKRPVLIAHTPCGFSTRLKAQNARTCHVPNPDAMLCGRCHGESASFGKHGAATKAGVKRTEAHVKLGCVVAGY